MLSLPRASHRYRSLADKQAALRMQIRDLAQARVSYGYRRLHVLRQREGWAANHKRVYRLYSQAIQPGGPDAEDEEAEAARVVSKADGAASGRRGG